MLTARTFLVRGLLAGLIAGVVTFGAAYLVGEPPVSNAIAFEESQSESAMAGHDHDAAAPMQDHSHSDEAVVSRTDQATWGLATATVVYGIGLGGLVGLAAAFALGRLGRLSPRTSTIVVAGIGFVSVYLVPFLKYPPNPPSVGNPDSIGDRTALYFTMLAVSLIAAVVAVVGSRRLARAMDGWNAVLLAVVGYVVIVGLVAWLLPVVDEVPSDFSADLLWQFRIASLIVQATMWAVIGVSLATMIGFVVRRTSPSGQLLAGTSS